MDEILVNTSIVGDQQASAIAGFRGTQYVVVWEDSGDATIKGQMFGANGNKTSSEFVVNLPGEPNTSRRLPAIVECGLGFAVAWIEKPRGAAAQVKLRTFDHDTLSGPEIQVSTAEVEALTAPAMARLADGGFVVVWADKRQDERIRAQRFGVQGEKNGPEFRVNTVPGLHREPMVACLVNGNIVIGWRARSAAPLLVHLQIFDANGPVGGEQITNLDVTDITMAALDSGRFVIAHVRNAFDGETGLETTVVQASVFEPNGVFTGIRISASAEQRILSSWPTLAPLPGGRCVLAWTQSQYGCPRGRQHCQGQGLFGKPKLGRSSRPGQYLDRRRTLPPVRRDDPRSRRRDRLLLLVRPRPGRRRHLGETGTRATAADTSVRRIGVTPTLGAPRRVAAVASGDAGIAPKLA